MAARTPCKKPAACAALAASPFRAGRAVRVFGSTHHRLAVIVTVSKGVGLPFPLNLQVSMSESATQGRAGTKANLSSPQPVKSTLGSCGALNNLRSPTSAPA